MAHWCALTGRAPSEMVLSECRGTVRSARQRTAMRRVTITDAMVESAYRKSAAKNDQKNPAMKKQAHHQKSDALSATRLGESGFLEPLRDKNREAVPSAKHPKWASSIAGAYPTPNRRRRPSRQLDADPPKGSPCRNTPGAACRICLSDED